MQDIGEDSESRLMVDTIDGATLVVLTDRKILGEMEISQISEQLNGLVAESDRPKLVLDFSAVAQMSSSALGMLITLHKHIRERDGQLRLCGIQPSIYEVFIITRLNEILRICRSQEEALSSF